MFTAEARAILFSTEWTNLYPEILTGTTLV